MKNLIFLLLLLPFFSSGQQKLSQSSADKGIETKTVGSEVFVSEDSASIYLDSANFFLHQRKTEEALNCFRKAAGFQPGNDEAYTGWINTSMQSDLPDEGMKAIDQWIGFNPENTRAWLYKAFLEAAMKHPETSLRAFDMLTKLQPGEPGNWVGRGQMLLELKRYEEALDSFEKSSSLDSSGRTDVLGMKAAALTGLKRYDEALILINKVLDDFPAEASLIYNRACIYSLKGDKANALNDLQRAINLDASLRQFSTSDEDFKSLWNDAEFRKLTE